MWLNRLSDYFYLLGRTLTEHYVVAEIAGIECRDKRKHVLELHLVASGRNIQKILREENILAKAQDTAKYLHEKLQATFLNHKNVGEIRHLGLINAIELVKDKDTKEAFDSKKRLGYQIYKNALQKGLLLRPLGDVLYFNPPLNIDKQTLDKAISICHTSINEVLNS